MVFCGNLQAGQDAVCVTDGAMVYQKADFDSQVIGYMRIGRTLRISSQKFGPFYRVQLRQGVMGYISDADLSVGGAPPGKTAASKKERPKSMLDRFYIGGQLGLTYYAELIAKQDKSSMVIPFGGTIIFPFRLFDGPFVLATDLLFSQSVPSYYQSISEIQPSGQFFFVASQIQYALDESPDHSGYYFIGAGPLFVYTRFNLQNTGRPYDLEDAKVGGVFSGGMSFAIGNRFQLRGEGRFYVEKSTYPGGTVQLLFGF